MTLVNNLLNERKDHKMTSDLYPNVRGTAKRHADKSVRVATHIDVLEHVFSTYEIEHVVEHGMGLGSTPFFHSQNLVSFLSYENIPKWQNCMSCKLDQQTKHLIKAFDAKQVSLDMKRNTTDPAKSLVFVDSSEHERVYVFSEAINTRVKAIVEHDAETFTTEKVISRRNIATSQGYECFQYLGLNPETALYVLGEIPKFVKENSLYVKL